MKKIFNILKIVGLCAITALVASCPSSLTTGGQYPDGKGAVHLSVAGSMARTIFPDNIGDFVYTAKFTTDDTAITENEITAALVNGEIIVALGAGEWSLEITARVGNDSKVVGKAIRDGIPVQVNHTTEVKDIFIVPVTSNAADTGTLVWSVEFNILAMTSARLFSLDADIDINLKDDPAVDFEVHGKVHFGEIDLPPGSYLFIAELVKDGKDVGNAESVHIYPGLTSTLTWIFDTQYNVAITSPVNGRVLSDHTRATSETEVTLTVTPNRGYMLQSLAITGSSGAVTPVQDAEYETIWTFEMPAENVTVTAVFIIDPDFKFGITIIPAANKNGTVTLSPNLSSASVETAFTLTAAPNPDYKLYMQIFGVTGESGNVPLTKTSDTTWTFAMPAEAVTVIANFVKEDVVYFVYSDGFFNPYVTSDAWETGVENAATDGGGHSGTTAFKFGTVTPWGPWGAGFGMNAIPGHGIDLNTVDALSFWAKASAPMTITEFGYGENVGVDGDKTYQRIIYGTELTTEWKRIVIPITRVDVERTQALFTWVGKDQEGKFMWIDDVEYISNPPPETLEITINAEADFSEFTYHDGQQISKGADAGLPGAMNFTITKFDSGSAPEWFLNGVSVSTNASYNLTAASLDKGPHSLTLVVKVKGIRYSHKIDFWVVD